MESYEAIGERKKINVSLPYTLEFWGTIFQKNNGRFTTIHDLKLQC